MNADGTNPRRITEVSGKTAWLPDQKKILIQRDNGLMKLDLASGATMAVAGAKARTLFAVDAAGKWLAYQTSERGVVDIAAIPVAGGTPRLVVTAPYEAYHPSFSPSGRWLYFQPNHKNVFRVPGPEQDWKSAPPEKVTDFSGIDLYLEDPKISRDGTKLFYTRGRRTGRHLHPQIGSGGQGQARNMTRLSGEREARHAVPPYSPSSPSAFILRWSVVRSRPRRSAARDTFPFVSARTRAR